MLTRRASAASIVLLSALGACGAQPRSAAPSHQALTAALKGSPPALSALHAKANRLISTSPQAFAELLRRLRGYPVVVNKWASWCGPCQSEFPAFQVAAVAYGRRVAFVGIDGKDSAASAQAFLRRYPVTYPSYVDPHEAIARSIQAATYFPMTVYIDPSGHSVFAHAGAYTNASTLEHDIRLYALKQR